MNQHTSQWEIIHPLSEGEDELHTNPVSKKQYLIDWEKQMIRQQQFLKIIALSFHKSLGKSYRNLLQNSESKNGCCHLQQDFRQMILDHESRLALYFELYIAKLLDLTTTDHNLLTVN